MDRIDVIFLDIDGVLSLDHDSLDNSCLSNLHNLMKSTTPFVVLSSSWRLDKGHRNFVKKSIRRLGGKMIGITPDLARFDVSRAMEIMVWIKRNNIKNFVILDDNDIFEPLGETVFDSSLKHHFVQTKSSKGLTQSDVYKAKDILKPNTSA